MAKSTISVSMLDMLTGLDVKQEMALYLRVGRSVMELMEAGCDAPNWELRQIAAEHKLELVDNPPAVTADKGEPAVSFEYSEVMATEDVGL